MNNIVLYCKGSILLMLNASSYFMSVLIFLICHSGELTFQEEMKG
jgi:hypothetical protein